MILFVLGLELGIFAGFCITILIINRIEKGEK